jgi:hypothetical protein
MSSVRCLASDGPGAGCNRAAAIAGPRSASSPCQSATTCPRTCSAAMTTCDHTSTPVVYRCETLDGCRINAFGGTPYGVRIGVTNNPAGAPTAEPASHHVWMINNVMAMAKLGSARTRPTGSSSCTTPSTTMPGSPAMRSDRASASSSRRPPEYRPTAPDQAWAPFHQVVKWNIVRGRGR